jgi:hypothetical protein
LRFYAPSFLVAVVVTGLFFSLFDPVDIYHTSGSGAEFLELGHYTIGLFSFWLLGVIDSASVLYFLKPCE